MASNESTVTDTMAKQIVIVGGGFAGVWAALGAAAQARRQGTEAETEITLYSPSEHLVIRPRLYEDDLPSCTVPLTGVLAPLGVRHVQTAVGDLSELRFDELILCAGGHRAAALSGPKDHGIDTLKEAEAMRAALAEHERPTVAVIGAGFTGLEIAAELAPQANVRLADSAATIAPEFGASARAVIESALSELGVSLHTGTDASAAADGADLIIWATSMRANPLAATVGAALDPQGRVVVDRNMHTGVDGIWAAGDSAHATVDGVQAAPMSCQHAMPQGVAAGANAVRKAHGKALKPYNQHLYLTCLDLGSAGALLTRGFDREHVVASGPQVKPLKRWINRSVIYPPPSASAEQLLKLGSPPAVGPRATKVMELAMSSAFVRGRLAASGRDHAAGYGAASVPS